MLMRAAYSRQCQPVTQRGLASGRHSQGSNETSSLRMYGESDETCVSRDVVTRVSNTPTLALALTQSSVPEADDN